MTLYSGIIKHFPCITFTCTVLWGIVLWTLVDRYQRFRRACCLHLSILKTETAGYSETLMPRSRTTWHRTKTNNFIANAVRTLDLTFPLFSAFYYEDRRHFPTGSGLSSGRGTSNENHAIINDCCWFSNTFLFIWFSDRKGYISHDDLIFDCGYFLQKDYLLWFSWR
jgi:hypothetical protein